MTGEEYLKFHSDICDNMKETCRKKNADYAGGNGGKDAFANFRLVEQFGAASSEQGFFTRMTDKMSRISTFIQKGILLVKDESVEDTLIDLANYCILFAGFLRSKRMERDRTRAILDPDYKAPEGATFEVKAPGEVKLPPGPAVNDVEEERMMTDEEAAAYREANKKPAGKKWFS